MQAVILAAGLGTRLRPVTADRSKAMVPVLGRPLVERAILPFVEQGIVDFIFVVSPDDTKIQSFFAERTDLRINVQFVYQEERLGMAHALGLAAPLVHGRFAVSACDSLLDSSAVRDLVSADEGADGVLSLLDVEPDLVTRSGVVEIQDGLILRIVEKPTLDDAPSNTVSLPHYVFTRQLLELLPSVKPSARGEFELQDAIQELIDGGGRVIGIRANKRFQVSSPEDLLKLTRQLFSDCSEPFRIGGDDKGDGTGLIEPFHIEPGVELGNGCEVGPEVYLESGCHIGDGAVVRRSIVLRGGRVEEGQTIESQVVV